MGRMKAKHRIADRLFFLLLTILFFPLAQTAKRILFLLPSMHLL